MLNPIAQVEKTAIDDGLPDYERSYLAFHRQRFEYLWRILDGYHRDNALLDIGCGAGHFLAGAKELGFSNLYGLDNIGADAQTAKRVAALGAAFKEIDLKINPIAYNDGFFDLIFMSEVLEHFDFFPGPVFKEISRVLKPGGLLVITMPNLTRLNNRIKMLFGQSINYDIKADYRYGAHWREYTRQEIVFLLETNGLMFKKVEFADFNYPDQVKFVSTTNKIIGSIISSLRPNLVVVAVKK